MSVFYHIFEKYEPSLVFLPRIDLSLDRSILRHAKKRSTASVGMINSWDNITLGKYPFRMLPSKLIVHNHIIKEEAVQYIDMPEEDIYVSGMPHFDHYVNHKRISRNSFCKRLGIDPKKKIVLFASIGSNLNSTEDQVLSQLDEAMKEGKFPKDIVFIFRFHPSERTHIEESSYSKRVVFDDSKTTLNKEQSYTEILESDMQHLADSLFHTEMTVATASTMNVDAAAFDKPSVCIAFDGREERPFHESVRRFYEPSHTHYQPIVKSGGIQIAYTLDELVSYINKYLLDPSLDREGRKRIILEQCYRLDGKAGKRIADFIIGNLT